MDGIHDLGGRQGFGPVEVDEPEEAFHSAWEARVYGIVRAMSRPADWSLDWFRHCRELIDPVDYLTRPYFDQWMQTYAAMLVNSGAATVAELAEGRATGAPRTAEPLPQPMSAADVAAACRALTPFDRDTGSAPRFAAGDRVRARSAGSIGHTRLPAYVRGREGVIHACHGAYVLPDANAHGEERAEPLYSVTFEAAVLWPEAAGRRERVYLDLWESYLHGV